MKTKKSWFLVAILLLMSTLAFSQTDNPYANFTGEQLKTHKEYSKNYNPITCKMDILNRCMLDLLNIARAELNFAEPLSADVKLDSIATMQAAYQGSKEEKTLVNLYPGHNTGARLNLVGYSTRGTELTARAKASRGVEEYSYYDLCLEMLKPILKNAKQAEILLDKKYTKFGFGVGVDANMKNVYASLLLGNDRLLNSGKPPVTQKIVPFTKKNTGLLHYDEKLCKKCNEDKNLEVLSQYIQVQGDEVYFVCDDHKQLRKLIGKEDDAIVLDFVQHSQYDCDGANVVDNNRVHHGFVSPSFTYYMMVDNNEITDSKSKKLKVLVAEVPTEITDNKFDINILLLKGKTVCRTISKKNIETKNANYTEQINLLKDEESIETKGDFVPTVEEGRLAFKVPFVPNKTDFTFEELEPLIKKQNRPYFVVKKIEIIAHNSLNYAKDAKQQQIQKKRAESLKNVLMQKYGSDIEFVISYDDSWEEFKKDVVYSEQYYDLTLFSKENAYEQLTANRGMVAKELEKDFLSKHRFAQIVMHVTYPIEGTHEQDFVVFKFNTMVAKKNLPMAMSIQKYMMKQVENRNYSSKVVDALQIPAQAEFQPLLINQLYMQNLASKTLSDKLCANMGKVYSLNQNNPVAAFNNFVCELKDMTLTSTAEIVAKQSNIDRFYTFLKLPKDRINSVNLEFQLKVLDFLNRQPESVEITNLKTATYAKIKQIRNPKLDSWQNAYKLAALFVKDNDYAYALELMDPFLNEPQLSNDFIFSYVSIGGYREEVYLSDNYLKMVQRAAEADRTRLCNMMEKMPICIFDNYKIKKIVCKQCK